MVERFAKSGMWAGGGRPRDARALEERVDANLGVLLEVADTGIAGTVVRLAHGLGKRPRGVVIVNQAVTGTTPVAWYRQELDGAWTDTEISLRFTVSDARCLLWVF